MILMNNPGDKEVLRLLKQRMESVSQVEETVKEIIRRVKEEGDRALEEFLKRFEKHPVGIENLRVTEKEISEAQVEEEFVETIKIVIEDLKEFHRRQEERSFFFTTKGGSFLGEMVVPLESVGIYVPGGKVPYFSTLLMCAVPAIVAGVERIAVTTPPNENGGISPYILKTCEILGLKEIYRMGGAHAVAALTYGTETVKPVDKIVGPGGVFVTLAKKHVYGDVGIDSIAGPSEIAIVTDGSADLDLIAADFLSQAEHDENAMSVVITTSKEVFEKLPQVIERHLEALPEERRKTARISTENFGTIILTDSLKRAFEISNLIAPEHLEVLVENPFEPLGHIKNAGSVFLGKYTCESVGDYGAGPNHVLPTFRSARFSSGLRVSDFTKKIFITHLSEEDFRRKSELYSKMARWEGFEAHARAIDVRREKL
ncbi:MAG TPA: histidinol dehydrogenase [Thermotoga sp.]|uniref:Histidinol dehydrogenase n=1 Tax=Thermotoga maritima (strain ATCC 43589 / DSM 3109 / JCM 10099 / NBRC 100826 / MSB8) TaxID=243274 RepID=HISX_THEMA|nr:MULTISPECIES: histidinol dehydrogenase [Thermotoga]Q9X0D1.1 RecName: Full=Histidinol dehydrogenase; Short=HDH [Thermotoga maritima MSB8]HBF69513.1 histidinol dehydrogenase [Thermotoga sp.]AAD36118.1 histidinol dehydrogenase [Thermotoga maritima MSB8]ACB10098.1 Histidinol dehydrogenase [Thermotoga sp. RQ2]AGL49969.1 Histidinol dehydrogenase [Thermotoga maritima MSB8]AHD19051.1 histidinol dehydrogenase [Thermotoga maritima MSB8]